MLTMGVEFPPDLLRDAQGGRGLPTPRAHEAGEWTARMCEESPIFSPGEVENFRVDHGRDRTKMRQDHRTGFSG